MNTNTKTVAVASLFLYYKPGAEMDIEGKRLDRRHVKLLRISASFMSKRLVEAAKVMDKLLGAGWKAEGGLYDISFYKKGLSKAEAKREIAKLGISLKSIDLRVEEDA
jgi:hypothetical protein